ncbi:hypothetical protein YC2023_044924 [Brassica napus]
MYPQMIGSPLALVGKYSKLGSDSVHLITKYSPQLKYLIVLKVEIFFLNVSFTTDQIVFIGRGDVMRCVSERTLKQNTNISDRNWSKPNGRNPSDKNPTHHCDVNPKRVISRSRDTKPTKWRLWIQIQTEPKKRFGYVLQFRINLHIMLETRWSQPSHVRVDNLDSESESDCNDFQVDEEDEPDVSKPTPPLAITEVISMIEDTTHFPDDLIWDDKIEDETIVNLVRGLSAAVLARMRAEKKQKEKEAKEKNERESQPDNTLYLEVLCFRDPKVTNEHLQTGIVLKNMELQNPHRVLSFSSFAFAHVSKSERKRTKNSHKSLTIRKPLS